MSNGLKSEISRLKYGTTRLVSLVVATFFIIISIIIRRARGSNTIECVTKMLAVAKMCSDDG